MTILIVDDIDINRFLLSCYLEGYDYKLIFAQNGKEALKLIAAEKPDLILTDIEMPVMNGIEMLEVLKGTIEIPIVVISSIWDQAVIQTCHSLGVEELISKPVSKTVFLNSIERVKSKIEPSGAKAINLYYNA